MTDIPLITTIITTYRRPLLLTRAVRSVLNQTYPNFQLCVYDNASNDETQQIMEEFTKSDSRVKYHRHPENLGMMGNYQYSFSEVTTPYFSFLSDDDLVLPWFYETALKGFEQHLDIVFSACSVVILDKEGGVIDVPLSRWRKEGYIEPQEAMGHMPGSFPVPNGVLFHSRVLKKTVIDRTYVALWDCDFLLRTAMREPIYLSKKTCALFLHHENSFSAQQAFETVRKDMCLLINKFTDTQAHQPLTEWLKKTTLGFVSYQIRKKNYRDAYRLASSYIKTHGFNLKSAIFVLIAKTSQYLPVDRCVFVLLQYTRRWFVKKHQLREEYGEFAQWL